MVQLAIISGRLAAVADGIIEFLNGQQGVFIGGIAMIKLSLSAIGIIRLIPFPIPCLKQ